MVKYQDNDLLIRSTVFEDCSELAFNLRSEDKEELIKCGQRIAPETIVESFDCSKDECYTVFYHGKIAMIYGLRNEGEEGRVWMLSSNEVKKFPLKFLKLAKRFLNEFQDKYGFPLYNYIHESNIQSMKLVHYCGADLKDGYTSNATGEPFFKFIIGD